MSTDKDSSDDGPEERAKALQAALDRVYDEYPDGPSTEALDAALPAYTELVDLTTMMLTEFKLSQLEGLAVMALYASAQARRLGHDATVGQSQRMLLAVGDEVNRRMSGTTTEGRVN